MEATPKEVETTLIIKSEDPETIVNKIASLDSVKGYKLLNQGEIMIHDLYFDTTRNDLKFRNMALRLREIEGVFRVTLKGPPRIKDWGGVERFEIEEVWSQGILDRIFKELKGIGVEFQEKPKALERERPLDVILNSGFQVIQDRNNHRHLRNIVGEGDKSGLILAEMAIDSVIYHFGDRQVRHYEIEIESKVKEGPEALKTVAEALIEMYRPHLQVWTYGKLFIGKAIEKMLSEGALKGLIEPKNNIKPAAYKLIDYYIGILKK